MEILRRDDTASNKDDYRENKVRVLMKRQADVEGRPHQLYNFEALQKQVKANTNRLDKHSTAINLQARPINAVLENLEQLKISSDENLATILAEVRKGNKVLETNAQADNTSPIDQHGTPPNPPATNPNQQKRSGWEHDWIPVADDELKQLVDREDPARKLIDHNLQGLTLI